LLSHQPGAHQHLDVARHGLQRDVEWCRQLRDEKVLSIQPVEDRPANRVGERTEDQIERSIVSRFVVHRRLASDRDEIIINLSVE
jgi:hypothetical protein